MFNDEEQEDGAEKYIVRLEEVTGPDLGRMIGQERCPCLPGGLRWPFTAHLAHVPADSAPIDAQAQLQEFASNALGAPPAILKGHLLDQVNGCFSKAWSACGLARGMSPKEREALPMPLEQRFGFDTQQGLFPVLNPTGKYYQDTSIERRETRVFHLPLQNDQLLAQQRIFGDKFRFAPH